MPIMRTRLSRVWIPGKVLYFSQIMVFFIIFVNLTIYEFIKFGVIHLNSELIRASNIVETLSCETFR